MERYISEDRLDAGGVGAPCDDSRSCKTGLACVIKEGFPPCSRDLL